MFKWKQMQKNWMDQTRKIVGLRGPIQEGIFRGLRGDDTSTDLLDVRRNLFLLAFGSVVPERMISAARKIFPISFTADPVRLLGNSTESDWIVCKVGRKSKTHTSI